MKDIRRAHRRKLLQLLAASPMIAAPGGFRGVIGDALAADPGAASEFEITAPAQCS